MHSTLLTCRILERTSSFKLKILSGEKIGYLRFLICFSAFMVASNSSNILTDAIADEDDDANAAELMAAAEELDLDDDEDTAGSGSSSAVSLQSISVG